jgi:hypothetical protein
MVQLWVDKYRPSNFNQLNFHTELNQKIVKLVIFTLTNIFCNLLISGLVKEQRFTSFNIFRPFWQW